MALQAMPPHLFWRFPLEQNHYPATQTEASSGEDVRGALLEAFTEHDVEVAEPGLRARGAGGKSAARETPARAQPEAAATAIDTGSGETRNAKDAGAAALQTSTVAGESGTPAAKFAPPNTWKAEAKAEWDKLPPSVQKYVTEREAEIHKGFTRFDEDRHFGKQIRDVITPHLPAVHSLGLQPAQAVQALLNADHTLRTGSPQQKTQLFSQLAGQYGVNIGQVVQRTGAIDPKLAELQTELNRFKQAFHERETQSQRQQQTALQAEIEQFSADKPQFPTLAPMMSVFLENGQAQDLQSAYEQAFRAHPETSKAWLEGEVSRREEARLKAIRDKSAQARNAAVSVTGAPGSQASGNAPAPTLREELEAQFRTQGLA
jgi:hypothetical protein